MAITENALIKNDWGEAALFWVYRNGNYRYVCLNYYFTVDYWPLRGELAIKGPNKYVPEYEEV